MKRKATTKEIEVFDFLNNLRNSGVTNMFGAASYIQDNFDDIKIAEARRLLTLWMINFNEEGDYEEIKTE